MKRIQPDPKHYIKPTTWPIAIPWQTARPAVVAAGSADAAKMAAKKIQLLQVKRRLLYIAHFIKRIFRLLFSFVIDQ